MSLNWRAALMRTWAILLKELVQMRRDRMTFAMILGIPIIQLVLFGFAINTDPKSLPTAIYAEDDSQFTRAIVKGFEHSGYYDFRYLATSHKHAESLLTSGKVSFVVYIPSGFTKALIKQQQPQILIEADASDPAASSNALGRVKEIINRSIEPLTKGSLAYLKPKQSNVDVVIHAKYNPENITQYNIVPGLLGVILTMTGVMITSMAMTRESEKGNLENILAMPARPFEVMLGKILPYIIVGMLQTFVILIAAKHLFSVPFLGSFSLLMFAVLVFIIANLCLGFTFSTIAKTQMQAMQMTFFFFLPSILLSGFMFPFRGMPVWAQYLGEVLPLTHFLRIIRGIMLKGAEAVLLANEFLAIVTFIIVIGAIATLRYRKTLD